MPGVATAEAPGQSLGADRQQTAAERAFDAIVRHCLSGAPSGIQAPDDGV